MAESNMNQRLDDVRNGRENNYVLPFLWMHDGHHDELPALVQQVYDSGARAFCVESRPHEQFCQQEWWDDMDVVLAEARKRDMKVWILDDKHFPTGYANGLISEKYPQLRKWQLTEEHVDVIGPAPCSAVLLNHGAELEDDCSKGCMGIDELSDPEDILIGVYAYKRGENDENLVGDPIDLTANVCGRYVFWDVPEGVYRVFALYQTRRGARQDYIHMIDAKSVHVLIEAVYEPHYEHYARYFGNTIAGFFSDEPSLGNQRLYMGGRSEGYYDNKLGQPGLALPWSEEVLRRMSEALGQDIRGKLAALWYPMNDGEPEVRLAYMDAVTELWRENFSMQIGEWCRNHGVEYIGHIIEDMDAHMRLTHSGGHFFRSLDGQDMAGIDVVLHQIMPGMAHYTHTASLAGGSAKSSFFDYILARLGTSLGHIQPRMRHRVMCEVFGAYGWAEGVPMMKHLMDHMLVRGVNHFVPHAFSPKYPDPDCPPHFGGGGCNPQFEAFASLMRYTNQAAHLLEGGVEVVSAAILYQAEAEWSGKDYMPMQEPAMRLYDAQLNYDILPIDALMEQARVEDGALCVEKMRYPMLIVPHAAYRAKAFLDRLACLEAEGLRVVFVNERPAGYSGGTVVKLEELARYVREAGAADVLLKEPFELLRVFHVKHGDGNDTFMLVNESMNEDFRGELSLPVQGKGVLADLAAGEFLAIDAPEGKIRMCLSRGQSAFLIFSGEMPQGYTAQRSWSRSEPVIAKWSLALKTAHSGKDYAEPVALEKLYNVTGPEGDPGFSGWMRYETEFTAGPGAVELDLGLVGECVHAWLNGVDLGQRIAAPYVYPVEGAIREGENQLTLEIVNTLVHQQLDPFSHYVQITPSGLLGPLQLLYR